MDMANKVLIRGYHSFLRAWALGSRRLTETTHRSIAQDWLRQRGLPSDGTRGGLGWLQVGVVSMPSLAYYNEVLYTMAYSVETAKLYLPSLFSLRSITVTKSVTNPVP